METLRLSRRAHDLHDVSFARHAGPLSRFPIRTPRPRRISMGHRRLRDHYDSDIGDIALGRLGGAWPELCARHAIGCRPNRALNELSLVWAECRKELVQACSEMQTVSPGGGWAAQACVKISCIARP